MSCKPAKRICVICGTEFETTYPRKKTCSDECQIKLARQNTRKWHEKHTNAKPGLPEKKCLYCGKLYKPNRSAQLYCSRTCRSRDYTRQQRWKGKKSKSQRQREKMQEKKNTSLVDIAVEARKAGMTYGQYVAKMGM